MERGFEIGDTKEKLPASHLSIFIVIQAIESELFPSFIFEPEARCVLRNSSLHLI